MTFQITTFTLVHVSSCIMIHFQKINIIRMIIGHFGFCFGFLFKCFHFLKAKVPKTSATSPATPSSASSAAKKPAEPPAPPMKGASSFKGPPTGLNEACKSMQKFLLFFL